MSVFRLQAANVVLSHWNILQVERVGGMVEELFIGYSRDDQLGRLSTPIECFDEDKGTGKTESGSNYQLTGKPGMPHEEAIHVLEVQLGKDYVRSVLLSENPDRRLRFRYPIV